MSACTDYDQNPSTWNTAMCWLTGVIPGATKGDYLTNPKAFPVAQLAPAAPQSYDQMVNGGAWTPDDASSITGASLASSLQAAINQIPNSTPPNDTSVSSNLWLIAGIVLMGVIVAGDVVGKVIGGRR